MSNTGISRRFSTSGLDDELEALGVGPSSGHAVVGILKHLAQTENGADAPQAPMPRSTLGEEVAKPAANQVEVDQMRYL